MVAGHLVSGQLLLLTLWRCLGRIRGGLHILSSLVLQAIRFSAAGGISSRNSLIETDCTVPRYGLPKAKLQATDASQYLGHPISTLQS